MALRMALERYFEPFYSQLAKLLSGGLWTLILNHFDKWFASDSLIGSISGSLAGSINGSLVIRKMVR